MITSKDSSLRPDVLDSASEQSIREATPLVGVGNSLTWCSVIHSVSWSGSLGVSFIPVLSHPISWMAVQDRLDQVAR